jgi:hypothetical protein
MNNPSQDVPGEAPPQAGQPTWKRPAALLVGAAALGLLVAAAWYWWVRPQRRAVEFPPGALADYLPERAGGVLTLNLRQTLDSPAGRQYLRGRFQQIVRRGAETHPWMALLGIDPLQDLDQVQVIYCAGELGRPLWLLRGRISPERFQTGPGKLTASAEGRFRLYEYRAGPGEPGTTLSLAGDTLVACNDRGRALAALNHAAGRRPTPPRDPNLVKLLQQVDRGQSLWAAVDFARLGPSGELPSYSLRLILGPVLRHAEVIRGGLTVAADVRGDFVFQTGDETAARELEKALTYDREVAKGAVELGQRGIAQPVDTELIPLVKLLSTAEVRKEGATVRLHCELPADQLGQ